MDERWERDRFEWIARALTDAIWDLDVETGAIEWSFGVGTQFGYSRERAGGFDWWTDNVHPEDRPRVVDSIGSAILDDEFWSDEYRFRHADGTWRTVHDRGVVIRNEHRRAIRMVGAMTDISEKKLIEARLKLADRMATIGMLAAGVGHEINNPLAFVLGNIDIAVEALESTGLPEDRLEPVRAALTRASEGASRIVEISRDLRSFARPDDARIGPVDVRQVLQSSLSMAQNEIRHRARVVKNLLVVPPVRGNESRLGQVFLNLLINASQAIDEGRANENEIRVSVSVTDGRVLVEVSDTGVGIEPAALGEVFTPFFSTKQGVGLGLSICRDIVAAHGGDIEVASTLGVGTTFRVFLPIAQATEPTVSVDASAARLSARLRVLVIDDEPAILELLQQILGVEHEVRVTTRARDALEWLSRSPSYDVILCDLMMPEMTGMEFHAKVSERWPDLVPRLLFVTGGAFTTAARQFLATTTNRCLEKPFRNAVLRDVIREVGARSLADAQSLKLVK